MILTGGEAAQSAGQDGDLGAAQRARQSVADGVVQSKNLTESDFIAHLNTGIHIQGLEKKYRGARGAVPAVTGIDVSIAPGETVALLGPNGAGKSTTIDMLPGLTQPHARTVMVFGQTARDAVDAGLVGGML